MKEKTIVAIVLGVLLLISVVQAVQLNTLKDDIEEGQMSVGSASTSSSPTSNSGRTTGSLPSNIKDLPQMVGGC